MTVAEELPGFGRRVAKMRQLKGLTQAQLAEAIGVSRVQVTNMEGGKHCTTLSRALRIADILGVSLDALVRVGCEPCGDSGLVACPACTAPTEGAK